ncbi:MAG: hypothetical protein GY787_29025 [Alteromonadales bacterium]|nr:hypothetical protein [Alteromonadales bacterium]
MAAQFWHFDTNFNNDIKDSLQSAKISCFKSGEFSSEYKSIEEAIHSTKQAIKNVHDHETIEDIKECLLDEFEPTLELLNSLTPPKMIQEEIDQLLIINRESGTKSILDIQGISEEREYGMTAKLKEPELENIFGTLQPTVDDVSDKLSAIAEYCDRYMSVYLIAYENNEPTRVFFAGYSAD